MKTRISFPAAIAMSVLAASSSQAALVYSGLQNLSITNSFTSSYVDVDAGTSSPTVGTGWDIDAFFGGEAFGNNANFQPVRQTVDINSAIVRLNLGERVDASGIYATAAAGSSTHIGSGPSQFTSGVNGYLGFRLFDNSGAGPFFGWMQVNLSNTGDTGRIIDWVYDNSGIGVTVGLVPEPSGLLLIGLGGMIMVCRRRR
jgi:hypothetical protein